MSLENYYPSTEERKRRDNGEKLEDTDRNLKEIKLDFSKDLNIVDEFISSLDNKAWYIENKTNLDNLIIKYKENRNKDIDNMKGDIEEVDIRLFTVQAIELLRKYREISDYLEEQISA